MGLGIAQRAASGRVEATSLARGGAAPPLAPVRPQRACPELDCLRGWLAPETIAAAARRAERIGTGADRVLVANGTIDDDIYVRMLAGATGVALEPLDTLPRQACPLDDARLIESCAASLLPLTIDGELKLAIAADGLGARNVVKLVRAKPWLAPRLRLTTAAHLRAFVVRHAAASLGERAAFGLAKLHPDLSAGPPRWRASLAATLATMAAVVAAFAAAPAMAFAACGTLLTALFLAWTALRIVGVLLAPPRTARKRVRDRDLPTYTVLAPLYREAASVRGLVAALRLLDYPREKLDVKLIVEGDDGETRAALTDIALPRWFEVVVAPNIGPRTKPKALNAALPFARGHFTVIYDAEDRPQPDQLRRAFDEFRARGDQIACVQASLTIDNTADNWLTAGIMAQTPQAV